MHDFVRLVLRKLIVRQNRDAVCPDMSVNVTFPRNASVRASVRRDPAAVAVVPQPPVEKASRNASTGYLSAGHVLSDLLMRRFVDAVYGEASSPLQGLYKASSSTSTLMRVPAIRLPRSVPRDVPTNQTAMKYEGVGHTI